MHLKVLGVVALAASLLGLAGANSAAAQERKGKDEVGFGGNAKFEMETQLRTYRMMLFGETAAGLESGKGVLWLDYSRNAEVKNKGILSFEGKTVVVTGIVVFRDLQLNTEAPEKLKEIAGPNMILRNQVVIVVESLVEKK